MWTGAVSKKEKILCKWMLIMASELYIRILVDSEIELRDTYVMQNGFRINSDIIVVARNVNSSVNRSFFAASQAA